MSPIPNRTRRKNGAWRKKRSDVGLKRKMIDDEIFVFTPVNPLRPHVDRLRRIHRFNVQAMNPDCNCTYVEKECVLPTSMQGEGIYRGQNVCNTFNEEWKKAKPYHKYVCLWHDDLLLPANILNTARRRLLSSNAVGAGIFHEDYGSPNILMVNVRKEGFRGSFQRFYMYKAEVWDRIPVKLGSSSGDPDGPYQASIKGHKEILDVPNIHLDHRAVWAYNDPTDMKKKIHNTDLYRVLLDMAWLTLLGFK